jgi:hypothetical protein
MQLRHGRPKVTGKRKEPKPPKQAEREPAKKGYEKKSYEEWRGKPKKGNTDSSGPRVNRKEKE